MNPTILGLQAQSFLIRFLHYFLYGVSSYGLFSEVFGLRVVGLIGFRV